MEGNALGVLLPEMRLDFWGAVLEGHLPNPTALSRRLKVLDLPTQADAPAVTCVLALENGERYLSNIWRYGRERLRVAVGNLLPHEQGSVLYGVCKLTTHEIHILACTVNNQDSADLASRVQTDVNALVESLKMYLDLEATCQSISPVMPLSDIAAGKA